MDEILEDVRVEKCWEGKTSRLRGLGAMGWSFERDLGTFSVEVTFEQRCSGRGERARGYLWEEHARLGTRLREG